MRSHSIFLVGLAFILLFFTAFSISPILVLTKASPGLVDSDDIFVAELGESAIFSPFSEPDLVNPFSDVYSSDWFYESVLVVYANNLMVGTSQTSFDPHISVTRAMFASILANLEHKDLSEYSTPRFTDVLPGQWYSASIEWAASESIVSGIGNNMFDPDASITREQMAVMLYNYIMYKGISLPANHTSVVFADESGISAWATISVKNIHDAGIVSGKPGNLFDPRATASRAEVASILSRFVNLSVYDPLKELSNGNDLTRIENGGAPQPGISLENPAQPTEGESGTASQPDNTEGDLLQPTEGGNGAASQPDNTTGDPVQPTEGGNGAASQPGNTAEDSVEPAEVSIRNMNPKITVGKGSAKPGESVQIAVSLENNPGVLGMILTIYYDEQACTLQSVVIGDAFSGIMELTTSQTLASGGRFVLDCVDISPDDIKDGSVMLMNFSIPQGTKEGIYPITLRYSDGDIIDRNFADVSPLLENGFISVIAK